MVTNNPRMSVSHNGHNSWTLTIDIVQRNDSGLYMCQINTEPMTSQVLIDNFLFVFKTYMLYVGPIIYSFDGRYPLTHKDDLTPNALFMSLLLVHTSDFSRNIIHTYL